MRIYDQAIETVKKTQAKPIPGINRKKCCMFCGCHLAPYAESDICEVCFDERYLDDILMDLDELEVSTDECY